jgi:hypothetical protein
LLSLLALLAVYATYLKQQQTDSEQQSRSDESIELLRQQTTHLGNQIDVVRQEAFDTKMSGFVSQLIQSIMACRRDHEKLGTIVGHSYFQQFGEQFWGAYIDSINRNDVDPWREARVSLLGADEGNWRSVRGQIEFIVRFMAASSNLTDSQRHQAMMTVTNQLTPGIAILFAVDTYLAGDTQLINLAQEFGMFRSIEQHLQDALKESGAYEPSAFGGTV